MRSISEIAADLNTLEPKQDVATRSQHAPKTDPMAEADAQYRRAWGSSGKAPWGKPLRAAFYAYLPESPRATCGTKDAAVWYLAKVNETIEMQCWSRSEQERLRQIQRKWERRAASRDSRYNAIGTTRGLNEKYRKKTVGDIVQNIYALIEAYEGKKATRPGQRFETHKDWPLGKPVT